MTAAIVAGLIGAVVGAVIGAAAPWRNAGLAVLQAALTRQDQEIGDLRREMATCEAERAADREQAKAAQARNEARITELVNELAEFRRQVITASPAAD